MTESDLQFIEKTTYGLQWYVSQHGKQEFDRDIFEDMICHIMAVLSKWTGETWVGHKKDKRTETVFQNFFETFVNLIGYINFFEKIMSDTEKEFANMTAYSGVLYRYLGSCSSGNKECIEIEYNDIYVSWSKNALNDYIESKLYGPQLWIKAQTAPFDFAIDLEGVDKFYQKITGENKGVARGNEREVVYPTKRECILEMEERC